MACFPPTHEEREGYFHITVHQSVGGRPQTIPGPSLVGHLGHDLLMVAGAETCVKGGGKTVRDIDFRHWSSGGLASLSFSGHGFCTLFT